MRAICATKQSLFLRLLWIDSVEKAQYVNGNSQQRYVIKTLNHPAFCYQDSEAEEC